MAAPHSLNTEPRLPMNSPVSKTLQSFQNPSNLMGMLQSPSQQPQYDYDYIIASLMGGQAPLTNMPGQSAAVPNVKTLFDEGEQSFDFMAQNSSLKNYQFTDAF